MSQYFKNDDISFEPFTRERENELFSRAGAGDVDARNEIIKNYLQFAASEGLREARGQFPEDEVLSAANWGLLTAVQRYDYKKGNGFACFARRFIRGRVGHLRRKQIRQASRERRLESHTVHDILTDTTMDHEFEAKDWQEFWLTHIKKAITLLPHNEQIAVNVIIFEEGDFNILGARLHITPHNARRTYKRAIETLKKSARKVRS